MKPKKKLKIVIPDDDSPDKVQGDNMADEVDDDEIEVEINQNTIKEQENRVVKISSERDNLKNFMAEERKQSKEFDQESHHLEEEEHEDFSKSKFHCKKIPKKILVLCIFLNIVGWSFLIAGTVKLFQAELKVAIPFLSFSVLLLIPGIYYSVQLFFAATAKSKEEQEDILSQIPNVN